MIRLIRTELTRFRVRPAVALLMAIAVLAAISVAFITAWDTRPPSRDELATAQAQASIDRDREEIIVELNKCLKDPAQYLSPGSTRQDCRDSLTPAPASYLPRAPLSLRGTLHGNGLGLALLVAVLLILAASVYVGADFASGAILNQVLAAPDRTRLWTAKAIAVGLWSLLTSTVVLGGFWGTTYLVAVHRDLPHGSAILGDVGWHLVRAIAFCSAAALGAFALTTLLRSAVATLGLIFAATVGVELALALLPVDQVTGWTLGTNVFGWLETRLTYFTNSGSCGFAGDCGPHHVTHLGSGLLLLALLLVALAGGLTSFRRRDL